MVKSQDGAAQSRSQTADARMVQALAGLFQQALIALVELPPASREDGNMYVAVEDALRALWLSLDVSLSPTDASAPEFSDTRGMDGREHHAAALRAWLAPQCEELSAGSFWRMLRDARLNGVLHVIPGQGKDLISPHSENGKLAWLAALRTAFEHADLLAMASWLTPRRGALLTTLLALLLSEALGIPPTIPSSRDVPEVPPPVHDALAALLRLVRGERAASERVRKPPGAGPAATAHDPNMWLSNMEPQALPVENATPLTGGIPGTSHTTSNPVFTPGPQQNRHGDDVQFTVYRPASIPAACWCKLLAFAHLAQRRPDADPASPDPYDTVRRQAEALLGAEATQYRALSEDASQPIPYEGQLTFLPHVPGVEFDPPRASFRYVDDVHRVEFRLQAGATLAGKTARGQLSVLCGSILVGEIALSLRVEAQGRETGPPPPDVAESARMYRKIFASYSHADSSIVAQFREHAKALGDRYLIDVSDLRSGEVWSAALERLIREADVFQLFWSNNSMRSPFVRQEYEYAISLHRQGFVRPTYWEQPMPTLPEEGLPPAQLARLHFQSLSASFLGPNLASLTATAQHNSAPANESSEGPDSSPPPEAPPRGHSRMRIRHWLTQVAGLLAVAAAVVFGMPIAEDPTSLQDSQNVKPAPAPEKPTPEAVPAWPDEKMIVQPTEESSVSARPRSPARRVESETPRRSKSPDRVERWPRQAVRRSLSQQAPCYRRCFDATLTHSPRLSGWFNLWVIIDEHGTARVNPSRTETPLFEDAVPCLDKCLSKITFPEPLATSTVNVRFKLGSAR